VSRRIAVLVLSLVTALAACSTPSYQYVRNSDTRTAFRIPTEWTVFDKDTMLGLRGVQPDVPDPIRWLVGIDADPQASTSHILDGSDLTTTNPQGIGLVQELSFTERDSASIQYMRNFLFPVDQLIQDSNTAEILSYDDQLHQDGIHGLHLVMEFRASALPAATSAAASASNGAQSGDEALQRALLGGLGVQVLSPEFVEVDQKVFVDDAATKIYYLAILCSASCYQQNHVAIEAAVNSWTVIS
jgi:hypothetical protein